MEKISCTNRVKNKEVLQRVKEERNILHILYTYIIYVEGRLAGFVCLQKHIIEGKIEGRLVGLVKRKDVSGGRKM